MKKALVILTLNEIEGVRALFDRIPLQAADECFVVDGGSTDGTREFFREKGIRVLEQKSRGRGEAFRMAVEESRAEVFCFFSPDGNEDPGDIPRLFRAVEEGADMAIARRFGEGARNEEDTEAVPARAWANRTFTWLANAFWNRSQYIQDTINGFRAVRGDVFRRLNIDAKGFLVEYQMSIRAMKLGLSIVEIPTHEGQRIGGESTARSIPTGLRFLKGLLRELWIGRSFLR